jgi:pimeloyl-ACP methyl ester carboxylesterase
MKALYPEASLVTVNAGHCPHDDAPAETSAALLQWLGSLKPRAV